MEQPNSFGEWVRRRRRSFDWTQEELARHVGCAVGTIRKIEADELRPSKQMAQLLAQHLDLPPQIRDDFVQFARGTLRGEFRIAPSPETNARPTPTLQPSQDSSSQIERPTGTVTFLFTDIEGSTRLWQQHPTAMSVAFARHHTLLRQTIEANQGYIFQIVGDAFCVAFSSAGDGVCAALSAQRALRDEPWDEIGALRVRMALHTGVVELRAGDHTSGEYASGVTLSQCAHLLACGHGGQVLVSQATGALAQNELPANATLLDLGELRLKDLVHPEHIYQLNAPDLTCEFPPLKTLDVLPNNLPVQLTSFIGRERELAEIKSRLANTRLLTLTGVGGTGKTRLAIQAAAEELEGFPNGVWLVELAPLADPALVAQTIAAVLGLREEPSRFAQDIVVDYLREKKLLLILDNCEHLIEACAKLADTLVHACPQLKILATSREALGIAGETPYRIPSLSLPPKNCDSETCAASESVRLFVDRAVTLVPSFAMTNQNALAVAQICQRLDGIPLALELAAARVKMLSVEQIGKKLDDRFKLLTGGSRTALPRQQTLRALIDWSYSLLSEAERVLLRRLSVFEGGWTLEAAQAVCSCDPVCEDDVLDLLAHLVDKSLVIVETDGEVARYRLMETIRQYAREKLLESDEGAEIRTRHLDFFLRFAEEAEPKLRGPEQRESLERLDLEHDNLRGALEWSTNEGCVERGMRLANALLWFWDLRAFWKEGRDSAEALLMQPEALRISLARASTSFAAALFLGQCGERKLQEQCVRESISIARELGDVGKRTLALSLGLAGVEIFDDDLGTAQSRVEEALAIARLLGDPWLVALSQSYLGSYCIRKRDAQRGYNHLEESLKLFESLGDKRQSAKVSDVLAHEDIRRLDFTKARWRYQQFLPFLREEKDKRGIRYALNALCVVARVERDYDGAKNYVTEALAYARDLGSGIFTSAGNLAGLLLSQGEIENAKPLFVECLSIARRNSSKAMMGYAIQNYAELASVQKQPRKAIMLFAVVRKLHDEAANKGLISPIGDDDFARYLAIAREQVDDATFNAAWAEGRAMTTEQAIEYALEDSAHEQE